MHKWKDGWSYRRTMNGWMRGQADRFLEGLLGGYVCERKEGRKEETVIYLRQFTMLNIIAM